MPWTSCAERRGVLQNVQGPRPSLTQITLPQFRQFEAAANTGWRAPIQLQRLFAAGSMRDVFVETSSARMAESRVERVEEAPCMDCPPVRDTFVFVDFFGAGEDVRETFCEALRDEELDLDLKSDIKEPAAEGGGRTTGACTAAGFEERAEPLLGVVLCEGRLGM